MADQGAELVTALERMIRAAEHGLATLAGHVADPTSLEPFRTLHATLSEIKTAAADLTRQLSPRVTKAGGDEQPGDAKPMGGPQ